MAMERPLIGICAATERARWGLWDRPAVLLDRGYVDAVVRAGGLAILLPPQQAATDDPDALLDPLDGLVLAGGVDVDPALYGQAADAHTDPPQPERDAFELALLRRALDRDLPVLAICRGMQVLNVALGGTLYQHLPADPGQLDHRRTPGSFDGADHDVRLESGSLAARAAGEEAHATKSHHHQGIDRLGEGLRATGWAEDDLAEAIELPAARFALGIQWHPEADERSRLIGALVEEARARAAA